MNSQASGCCDTKSAAGAAIHKLRQLKQSIRLPEAAAQAGAKSHDQVRRAVLACQQVCYPPGGKDGQDKPGPEAKFVQSLLAFEIVADADGPKRLRPVGAARKNSPILDPQPKHVVAALAAWQQQISRHGIRYLRTAQRIERS